jgi:hypothetical protein
MRDERSIGRDLESIGRGLIDVLSRHSFGGAVENYEISESEYPISRRRYELSTFQIRVQAVTVKSVCSVDIQLITVLLSTNIFGSLVEIQNIMTCML